MQRRVLLVTVVVLALVAAYFATREGPRHDGAADLARTEVEVPRANRVELATPAEPDSVASRATVLETRPAEVARPSWAEPWTGVRVRVVAVETGSPIRRAEVRAAGTTVPLGWTRSDGHRAEIGESARTDSDGFADLALEAGAEYRIVAQAADGGASAVVALDRPLRTHEVRAITVTLPTMPDLVVHGRVFDRETRTPIAGARVGRTKGWREIEPDDVQLTDADGRFRIEAWSWRGGTASVIASGYEYAWTKLGDGHPTAEDPLELPLSRAASARLTVLDRRGAPIAGVRATLSTSMHRFGRSERFAAMSSGWPDAERFDATTDEHGAAVFAELPPRMPLSGVAHQLDAEIYRPSEPMSFEPGEARELVWRIGSGCTIRGIAREIDGTAAVDVAIWLDSAPHSARPILFDLYERDGRRSVQTGPDGRFEFRDVGPGAWWLGPAPEPDGGRSWLGSREVERDAIAPLARVLTIAPGAATLDVEVRLHRGLSIAGRVLDPSGEPATAGFIAFTRASDASSGTSGTLHNSGDFLIGPIEDGEYELRAHWPGNGTSDAVRARPGDTDVVLKLRSGAVIRGVVVDSATGAPLGAVVTVHARTPSTWSAARPTIAAGGSFQVGGLEAGRHDVVARTPSGLFGFVSGVDVADGSTHDVRVALERAALVRIRFEGPWPVCAVSIRAGDALVVAEGLERATDGTFAVPAGALVVRVRDSAGGPEFEMPVTTKAGDTRELVFDGAWK